MVRRHLHVWDARRMSRCGTPWNSVIFWTSWNINLNVKLAPKCSIKDERLNPSKTSNP